MKRWQIRVVILAVWLVLMGWLIRYEAFPHVFARTLPGYKALISRDVLMRDSWMKILFNEAPIGFSSTTMEMDDQNPLRRYVIRNIVDLRIQMLGTLQDLRVDTEVYLNAMQALQQFSFKLSAQNYTLSMIGTRDDKEADMFIVRTRTGNSSQQTRIRIPPDVVVYSPMTELAMRKLRPGQSMTVRTLDPASLSSANVTLRALRNERRMSGGVEVESTVLSTEYRGLNSLTWMGADGSVLRQETPFGWTLEKCTPEEAFQALREAGRAGDLLKAMAVQCEGLVRAPRTAQAVRYALTGVEFPAGELDSPRQSVERREGDRTVLLVRRAAVPKTGGVPAQGSEAFTNALAATLSVQSDDPQIVAKAREIVGDATDPRVKAQRIADWVYRNVKKEMTVSLPSALDVLRTMRGDCNEHTYLFVGLARAAGIPATIKVGLALYEDRFFYHAWPAVYVGEWVELDPTWGQPEVDATHIAFVEGELAGQMGLARILGRLKIEILEEIP